jgi:hypothetical protein
MRLSLHSPQFGMALRNKTSHPEGDAGRTFALAGDGKPTVTLTHQETNEIITVYPYDDGTVGVPQGSLTDNEKLRVAQDVQEFVG